MEFEISAYFISEFIYANATKCFSSRISNWLNVKKKKKKKKISQSNLQYNLFVPCI